MTEPNQPLDGMTDAERLAMLEKDVTYWREAAEESYRQLTASTARPMRLVLIESPFAGNGSTYFERVEDGVRNVDYAMAAVRDCIERGEAPICSHLLFPGILNDNDPGERATGIAAGLAWLTVAHLSAVYIDRGISAGMRYGIAAAQAANCQIEYRNISGWK